MRITHRTPVVQLTIWGLLSLWLFFGGLELAEDVHFVPETTAADLDQEALSQLASGLKPDVLSVGAPGGPSFPAQITDRLFAYSVSPVHHLTPQPPDAPLSLRLHQLLSVYRI